MKRFSPEQRLPERVDRPREPNSESLRNKRERLASLESEIEHLRFFVLDVFDRFGSGIPQLRRHPRKEAMARIIERFKGLEAEAKQLRFDTATPSERLAWKEECDRLEQEIAERSAGDQLSGQEKRLVLQLQVKLKHRKQRFPEEKIPMMSEQVETLSIVEQEKRLESSAREAILYGIRRLAKDLESIRAQTGTLPTAIFYPETCTRPLRYALQPLVRETYSVSQQAPPQERFIKTFSRLSYADDHAFVIEQYQETLRDLIECRAEIIEERDRLLRRLALVLRKERDEVSLQAHELSREIDRLGRDILHAKERLTSLEKRHYEQSLSDRLERALVESPNGPILVVDDLLARGRTFTSLHEALKKMGREEDAHYFAFVGNMDAMNKDVPFLRGRLSLGVGLGEKDSSVSHDVEYVPPLKEQEEMDSLLRNGFPYRVEKEQATGVRKDQFSPEGLVEKSPEAEPVLMRSVREKYQAWGTEALAGLETSLGEKQLLKAVF